MSNAKKRNKAANPKRKTTLEDLQNITKALAKSHKKDPKGDVGVSTPFSPTTPLPVSGVKFPSEVTSSGGKIPTQEDIDNFIDQTLKSEYMFRGYKDKKIHGGGLP